MSDSKPKRSSFRTRGGVRVEREIEQVDGLLDLEELIDSLDLHRGALLASSYEYPGRYTRWDMGFRNPPLVLEARAREFRLEALNERGAVLLPELCVPLEASPAVVALSLSEGTITGHVREAAGRFPEEERSRQPSVFSVLRTLVDVFSAPEDAHLGLYGAFGYDLALQFEPLRLRLPRPADQRDLVLYLPDELLLVDHRKEQATRVRYDFELGGASTRGLARTHDA